MADVNMTELRKWQRDVAAQSGARDKLTARIVASAAELTALDAQIAAAAEQGAATAALQKRRARVADERKTDVDRFGRASDQLRDVLDRIRLDAGDADPDCPLALLPVRLETRYTADGAALRVRIYPDDIHIDSLDRGVSVEESAAGMAYWTSVWRASEDEAAEAWRTLLAGAGRLRALWVARALRPLNLEQRAAAATPEFPDVAPRAKPPAVARLLPDVFSATVVQGAQRTTATGRPILPELVVGLFAPDLAALSSVHGVKVAPGTEWLADYAEAERVGMAVTVPLPSAAKIDRVIVYGVRRSLQSKAAPEALAALLDSHRCGRGLAFVPQGTPTNNSESDRAGWQRRNQPPAPLLDAPPIDERSNASVLAAALGFAPEVLADIEGGDGREQARAQSMNVALWGASWGSFLDKVNRVTKDGATLSDAAREDTRAFHRDHVRGRGPLPAIRVGNQPYGILPVSLSARWRTDRFEAGLLPILTRLRDTWRRSLPNVPRVGVGPIDTTLLELLGSTPICEELRVRPVLASEFALLGGEVSGASAEDVNLEKMLEELIWEAVLGIPVSQVHPTGSLGEQRPLTLPLAHESDITFIAGLLANKPPAAASVFQALLELSWDHAAHDVSQDSGDGRLAEVVRNAAALTASDRERTLAVATRAETLPAATLFAEAARVSAAFPAGAPTLAEFQPVAALRRSFSELALESTNESARAELGLFGTYSWLNSHGRLNEIREALGDLKDTTVDERRILVAETLDTASHRLDAWITGLVERRRRAQRAARPAALTIGAYGWVEDIEPSGGRDSTGGFLHAPSLSQAATAGILRSAYLSHNADAGGDGAFAIDLSSGRVRSALHLVDGIRQGQPLGGLLGYRCERAVHEAGLDRFILSLRKLAPLTQGKLTDRGEQIAPGAVGLAAGNVLDGVELVEKYQGKVAGWSPQRIRDELNIRPSDNQYLVGDWDALTEDEWTRIEDAIRQTAAALDAVADLLLAESVYQLVSGSTDRAAAALDAASGGDSPPPEPGFITTPVEGMPFTHRILALAGDAAPWNVTRPRSAAEPRLEAWAAARLGDPATIVIATAADGTLATVSDSGQCALDLIYDATDRAGFEQRLRAALPAIADAVLADTPDPAWASGLRAIGDVFECAASLRALMVRARPVVPSDLTLPNVPPVRLSGLDELAASHARAQNARDLLDIRTRVLDALLTDRVADPERLRPALEDLAAFGLVPPLVTDDQLPIVAQSILASAIRRLKAADAALALPPAAEAIGEAGQALFGEGFWIVPAIDPPDADDAWSAALGSPLPGATATAVRLLLTDYAAIRDGTRRYLEMTMLADAPPARAVQLAGAGKTPATDWVGGPLPPDAPTPDTPVVSTVLDIGGNYDGRSVTAGLVFDEWVEVVPIRARRGAAADAPVVERLTTGVTFNAMAASARAPQAILLAVAPDASRWTGSAIVEVIEDTMELARLRAVTLERTNGVARILPALYEQSWSLQGEKVLQFAVTEVTARSAFAAYVKDQP